MNKKLLLRRETLAPMNPTMLRGLQTPMQRGVQGGSSVICAGASFVSGVLSDHYLSKVLDKFDEWVTQSMPGFTENCPSKICATRYETCRGQGCMTGWCGTL